MDSKFSISISIDNVWAGDGFAHFVDGGYSIECAAVLHDDPDRCAKLYAELVDAIDDSEDSTGELIDSDGRIIAWELYSPDE